MFSSPLVAGTAEFESGESPNVYIENSEVLLDQSNFTVSGCDDGVSLQNAPEVHPFPAAVVKTSLVNNKSPLSIDDVLEGVVQGTNKTTGSPAPISFKFTVSNAGQSTVFAS